MATVFDFLSPDQTEVEEQRVIRDPGAAVGDVLTVQSDKSIAAAPGGGSLPGAWQLADFLFTEQDEAGDIVGTLDLPAGSYLVGYQLKGVTDWFDIAANFKLEDESDTYIDGENAAGSDRASAWLHDDGSASTGFTKGGVYYPAGQTITLTYTTTDADPAPTGQTRVSVIYTAPVTTTDVPA